MSPMIDLVFLLLIFFIVNANIITVQVDDNVEVPVASHSQSVIDARGRIVINIYQDGTILTETGETLEEDLQIQNHIGSESVRISQKNPDIIPVLHLRGDHESFFLTTQKVVKNASLVGIEDIRFATFTSK